MEVEALLYVSIGWAFTAAMVSFLSWQLSAYIAKSKSDRHIEALKHRLDRSMSEETNLRGEIGALRNRLIRAEQDSLRAARKASEFAKQAIAGRPRVDEVHILGGQDLRPEFANTERMCHV